jgi:hypothetical protein
MSPRYHDTTQGECRSRCACFRAGWASGKTRLLALLKRSRNRSKELGSALEPLLEGNPTESELAKARRILEKSKP